MMELVQVSAYYDKLSKRHYVLKDVSLAFDNTRNLALFGVENQDVSFCMKLLSRNIQPQKGKIKTNRSFSWHAGMAHTLKPEMTVAQNVKFLARIYIGDSYLIAKVVDEIRVFTEIGKAFDLPLRHLTPEMKSRLNIALTLFLGGECIVLDRVLGNAKTPFALQFTERLKEKIEEGNTLLMTTPHIQKIREFCSAGLVLDDGTLSYYDDLEQAIEVFKEIKGRDQ